MAREGMFALALERRDKAQKLVLGNAVRREKISDFRLAGRDGTGLIEHNDLRTAGLFKRGRRFEENAVFRADAAADHDGDRRGKPKRTRAADNEHRPAARERVSNVCPMSSQTIMVTAAMPITVGTNAAKRPCRRSWRWVLSSRRRRSP